MNKLEEIILDTRHRVAAIKTAEYKSQCEQSPLFQRTPRSMKQQLQRMDMHGIIAEFKRQSPSKGPIHLDADIGDVTKGYEQAGASAVSILTEPNFFLGANEFLTKARACLQIPILRKDFIVDEIQIIEAKAIGADCILLIASALSKKEMQQFTDTAHNLGLEVLVEIRDKEEIELLPHSTDVVGVNNRNLKTFSEGIEQSIVLSEYLPTEIIRISESSISKASVIRELRNYGYSGFLIGEYFMRHEEPAAACKTLMDELNLLNAQDAN
ncbi:MAG TPA: indole-3-glycerol phosphate synthase TrpC [Flavobacteriales bacterium]